MLVAPTIWGIDVLVSRRSACDGSVRGYAAELAALRREGAMRQLSDEELERIFAVGFALDQLRLHLRDLARCVAEFAGARGVATCA